MLINEMTKQNTKTSGLPTMMLKESLGSRKTDSSNATFKDVFSGTVNKDTTKSISASNQNKKDDTVKQAESRQDNNNGAQIHSYRELQRSLRNEVRKNLVQAGKSTTDSGEGNDEPKVEEEAGVEKEAFNEAVMSCFANLTGLKPEEFKAVLEKAGVSSEELANLTDIEGIAEKIASVTGLSGEQKDTLAKLMSLTAGKISAMVENQDVESEIPVEDDSSEQKIKIKVQVKANEDSSSIKVSIKSMTKNDDISSQAMFQSVLAKLKLKLDELCNKLNTENSGVIEEIDTKLGELLNSLKDSVKPVETKAAIGTELKSNDNLSAQDEAKNQYDNLLMQNVKEKKTEAEGEIVTSEAKPAVEVVTNADNNTQAINPLSIAQNQKSEVQAVNEKIDIKAPVQAKEVISQVIEKAKIVITPDKSEMIMDLKPESLGKLSLKVVTEQGIVMAKFVAESEQVKQILESNMQLLKDSLEKQGMSVQSISVSVRQDNNFSSGRWHNGKEQGQTSAVRGTTGIRRTGISAAVGASESLTRNNPYNWGSSTINLTA